MAGTGVCSIAGAVHDVLGYVHPSLFVPHDGMKFTTPTVDQDTWNSGNCARYWGGGWWHNTCSAFAPTTTRELPSWYSPPNDYWYLMKNIHLMIKLQ